MTKTTTRREINIYRDTVWSGKGVLLEDGSIVDCAAQLGSDQDETEEIYEAIEEAIEASEDIVLWGVNGEVNFTWRIGPTY